MAIGTSIKREASSRFEGFWNIRTNSLRRLDRDCSEADCASLFTHLVEGAIVWLKPPRSGLHKWCAKGSLNGAGDTKNPNKHQASACHRKRLIDTSVRRVLTPITETRNRTIKSSVEKSKGSERQSEKDREGLVRRSWGGLRLYSTLASNVDRRRASWGW